MTFLKKHWWIFVAGFVVTLTAIGCSSEDDVDGTLEMTKTEIVNLLTTNDAISCSSPIRGDGSLVDNDEYVVRCNYTETNIFIVGKEDEVSRFLYSIGILEPLNAENEEFLEELNFLVGLTSTHIVFGKECDYCHQWFLSAFEEVKRTGEDVRTVMEGIYVSVGTDVENGIAYEATMDARYKNLDISEAQNRYSCERLAEESIELSEEDEDAITIMKIYNLKHTVEYDLDMHIKRYVRKHDGIQMVRDPMRISECNGDALLEDGRGTRNITLHAEEYMDGEIFTGYQMR